MTFRQFRSKLQKHQMMRKNAGPDAWHFSVRRQPLTVSPAARPARPFPDSHDT
jgi:hypothetical protein